MDNELETFDSSNEETQDENTETTDSENSDQETKKEFTAYEKQLYARNKELEAKLKEKDATTKEPTKSDDFGYDVKAYLKSSGIKSDEFDFVRKELKAANTDLDTLLDNEYFQAKLEKHRAITKTAEATPSGKRSGGVAVDSVDYWAGKPIEEVPASMRLKVVNARLATEKNKGVFYNS